MYVCARMRVYACVCFGVCVRVCVCLWMKWVCKCTEKREAMKKKELYTCAGVCMCGS